MKHRWNLIIILIAILVSGCSNAPGEAEDPFATARQSTLTPTLEEATELIIPLDPTEGVPTTMNQPLATPFSDAMQTVIDQSQADLAERLSVSIDQVNLLGVFAVTWPDASLGCPEEGMMYAQVLTPGYLIQMESGNVIYEYHSGENMQQAVFCDNPAQPLPGNPDS
jgi:PBP1b-binding outer membrane lipoprotein LpoB